MSIDKIQSSISPINAGQSINKVPAKADGPNFSEMLSNAVREVDSLQKEADKSIEHMITRKGGVTPHEAMIALEKADIAFQLMNRVKSKIVAAYQEVMRTQI